MRSFLTRFGLITIIAALGAGSVSGGTNGFTVPAIRSAPGSSFAGWEVFTSGNQRANRPDIQQSTQAARLKQKHPNGFITGSGNIYNVTDISAFEVSFASAVAVRHIVFQARTLGAEIHYDSVKIIFEEAGARKELAGSRVALEGGAGAAASLWQWDLSGRGVTVFNIEFSATGPSMSFDSATLDVSTEVFRVVDARANLDRWMYPFNATPGTRASASVFAAFGEDAGVDTRDGQFLLGWNTSGFIATNKGSGNYALHKARVTLTINREAAWIYDGTPDDWRTYLTDLDPRHITDPDPGRPVELFGAGFRGGFTAASFPENGPFGGDGNGVGVRSAYAAGFDAAGNLVDVSNNVGKSGLDAFEALPWAVGTAALEPGTLAPAGTRIVFDVDVSNPLIAGYFASALNEGVLRLTVSSLLAGSFSSPNYAQFFTKENALALSEDMPRLELEAQILNASPILRAELLGSGKVRFSWAPDGANYELEWADSLGSSATWTVAPSLELALPEVADGHFFRLRRVL